MAYDINNIFAKILRGEIPCKKIAENNYALAFYDINPAKKIHALVIPKGQFENLESFMASAALFEMQGFWDLVKETTKTLNVSQDGYRLIANTGINGGQEVPHFHIHILGGESVGAMVAKK